jgi:hypothetical protein
MTHTLPRDSGWVVCRDFREIPVPDVDVLRTWAERGRLRPDDYLANGRLEMCVQARDVAELNAIFRRRGPLSAIREIFAELSGSPKPHSRSLVPDTPSVLM